MTTKDYYEKIGEIAKKSTNPIKTEELANMLAVENDRGVYSRIRGAFNHFINIGDGLTAGQISKTFIDKDGDYAYMK